MLRIYHSNNLDTLRDLLVELIKSNPLNDPFASEQVLVQSPGMAQWLKLELAERVGVAACVDFPLPASFLWRMFTQVLEQVPEQSAYSKTSLTWVLQRVLEQYLEQPDFAPLQHYLKQDSDPLRLYHLCARIADLFDQYLVYRPDWISDWEQGELNPVDMPATHRWQPLLWQVLVEDIQSRGLPHWHRANMFQSLITALQAQAALPALPPRLFVFGISALPDNYLQMLAAIGERVDIHLMQANPCRHYWGDIIDPGYLAKLHRLWLSKLPSEAQTLYQSGHPLLASMGKQGRDYLHNVQALDVPQAMLFDAPCYSTLLQALQSDILELEDRSGGLRPEQNNQRELSELDTSLALHASHSPLREVEILQDQLLARLEADPALTPRDIIVMVPDIALYAPYIDAVFGNGKPCIPYAISDRTADKELPLISSFLQLISLERSRFTLTQVIELLELPATLRRFKLTPDNLETLQVWLQQAGVHWGLDETFRQALSLGHFRQNSWSAGMDRLFSGYAMGDTGRVWQNTAPLAAVSGGDAELLGQLGAFLAALITLQERFSHTQSLTVWAEHIHWLLEQFYTPDEEDQPAIALIHQALDTLQNTLTEADYGRELEPALLQYCLQESLTQTRSSPRFLSGALNFCTLMPMRAIPFKVVCLLGMNDGQYPRALPPTGFDLMQLYPRKGDRSRRDDDRYLFLEAILSAKEQLYISYVGRSVQDNSVRIPTVLVSELLSYCDQAYRLQGEARPMSQLLLTEHPLSPYSRRYFSDADKQLFSYQHQWCFEPTAQTDSPFVPEPLPPWPQQTLELSALQAFYRNPVRHFFEQRLRVYFPDLVLEMSDEEPFSMDGLDDYSMRQRMLEQLLQGDDIQQISQYALASGELPVGLAGRRKVAEREKDVRDLYGKLLPLLEGEAQQREIRLHTQGLLLQGWITHLYPSVLLAYSTAKVAGRHRFSFWITHLALCATGEQRPAVYRGLSEAFRFTPVPPQQAQEALSRLVAAYQQGMQMPLNWLPEPAWAWLTRQQKDVEKAQAAAQAAYSKAASCPYVQRVYDSWEALEPGILAHSEYLFGTMLNQMEDADNGPDA